MKIVSPRCAIEWKVSDEVGFAEATSVMQDRATRLRLKQAPELIWLLEHPALVSLGRSALPSDLLPENTLPVVYALRGGRATCHAPGQRIVYFALDLRAHKLDIRAFVQRVGEWLCATLATWNLDARTDKAAIGVWVGERKIAAMGFRVSRGIATHGIALNRAIDLSLYRGIVACGLGGEEVVTSMENEGAHVSREALDRRLNETCPFL